MGGPPRHRPAGVGSRGIGEFVLERVVDWFWCSPRRSGR